MFITRHCIILREEKNLKQLEKDALMCNTWYSQNYKSTPDHAIAFQEVALILEKLIILFRLTKTFIIMNLII